MFPLPPICSDEEFVTWPLEELLEPIHNPSILIQWWILHLKLISDATRHGPSAPLLLVASGHCSAQLDSRWRGAYLPEVTLWTNTVAVALPQSWVVRPHPNLLPQRTHWPPCLPAYSTTGLFVCCRQSCSSLGNPDDDTLLLKIPGTLTRLTVTAQRSVRVWLLPVSLAWGSWPDIYGPATSVYSKMRPCSLFLPPWTCAGSSGGFSTFPHLVSSTSPWGGLSLCWTSHSTLPITIKALVV